MPTTIPASGLRLTSTHNTFTDENVETAMCLWEAARELRGDDRAINSTDTDDRAVAARALDRWFEAEGTAAVRHGLISWVPECEAAWEAACEAGTELEPYDWEHCPDFLVRKLAGENPDG